MKRLLPFSLELIALATLSCTIAAFLSTAPSDVIAQTVSCSTDGKAKAERFKVLSTHAWSQGVIVLYSALCPTNDGASHNGSNDAKALMQPVFGHKVMRRNGNTWQVSSTGSYGVETASVPSEQFVTYGISRSQNQSAFTRASVNEEHYAILYGQVLQPKVLAVEATFDNGKTLRDETHNGSFVLISAGATGVCELRVLGLDNQILRQEKLTVPKQWNHKGQKTQCLPISQQL